MVLTADVVQKMKVTELKAALKDRGCKGSELSGVKAKLVDRLLQLISVEETSNATLVESFPASSSSPDKVGFSNENDIVSEVAAVSSDILSDDLVKTESNKIDTELSKETIESQVESVHENTADLGDSQGNVEPNLVSGQSEEVSVEESFSKLPDERTASKSVGGEEFPDQDSILKDEKEQDKDLKEVAPAPAADLQPAAPEPTTSTISDLLGESAEEDDELRELREVEEKKLREAVKLSMARQAVKKSMMVGATHDNHPSISTGRQRNNNASVGGDSKLQPPNSNRAIDSRLHSAATTTPLAAKRDGNRASILGVAHDHSSPAVSSTSNNDHISSHNASSNFHQDNAPDASAVDALSVDQDQPPHLSHQHKISTDSASRFNSENTASESTDPTATADNSDSQQPQERTFASSINPISTHLRIDHFQRPINTNSVRKWIEGIVDKPIAVESIWFNAIKTHCYVDFETESDAILCRTVVHGAKYPTASSNILFADFTSVSAKDAPTALEAQLKPGTWYGHKANVDALDARKDAGVSRDNRETALKITTTPSDGTLDGGAALPGTSPHPGVTSPSYASNKRKLGSVDGTVGMHMLKAAATNAAISAKGLRGSLVGGSEETGFSTRKNRAEDGVRGVGVGVEPLQSVTIPADGAGYSTKRNRESADNENELGAKRQRSQENAVAAVSSTDAPARWTGHGSNNRVRDSGSEFQQQDAGREGGKTLEELFRKTAALPGLFWLPVSEEVVEQRRRIRSS